MKDACELRKKTKAELGQAHPAIIGKKCNNSWRRTQRTFAKTQVSADLLGKVSCSRPAGRRAETRMMKGKDMRPKDKARELDAFVERLRVFYDTLDGCEAEKLFETLDWKIKQSVGLKNLLSKETREPEDSLRWMIYTHS